MFLQNKYTRWYHCIIQNAKSRIVDGYTESHHIIPKSLGGSDTVDNLVILTAREHFVCHLLLTKMVKGAMQYKMHKAATMMAYRNGPGQERYKTTGKIYEMLKKSVQVPLDTRQKMGKSQKERFANQPGTFLGKTHSANTRKKISDAASKPRSDAWKLSASKNRKGKIPHNQGKSFEELYGKERANQIKAKQRHVGTDNGFYGKHHTAEQRAKKSKEKLESPKKICYHCSKEVDAMNYGRWHGDKCKKRT
jgi:hypothetical protein